MAILPKMQTEEVLVAERPRNVTVWQAAAILYGDWGTSKAYILGLAFAIAAYSSFWLVLGVSILSIFVALNYILICKYYPNGGGVYSSVRTRSKVLAMVGGFFLTADYIVTASLSALSAFNYLGVESPELWAIFSILLVGLINFLGPRHSGSLAVVISLMTFAIVVSIGILSIPHWKEAQSLLEPIHTGWRVTWIDFVSIIVALSGIEAIANTTGVMKLDPGSTLAKPSVSKTATPAILLVLCEVSFFTVLFAFMTGALPGLHIEGTEMSAPGYPNVRDAILRYMGEVFATDAFGASFGKIFGIAVSFVFGMLLLSAVNTALVGLNSLFFVMAHDKQLPEVFKKLNRFGVPYIPLAIATLASASLLVFVHDMEGLANLYAVGFVGAIATNLGATATNQKLPMLFSERAFMVMTCFIMTSIEITLFIEKPDARTFVIAILAGGLLLRALVLEHKEKKVPAAPCLVPLSQAAQKALHVEKKPEPLPAAPQTSFPISLARPALGKDGKHLHQGPLLCATTHIGKSLEFAIEECLQHSQKLYLLFIREQKINHHIKIDQNWLEDPQACSLFDYTLSKLPSTLFSFIYAVSSQPGAIIVDKASSLPVARVILGKSRESRLIRMVRGNTVNEVRDHLPKGVDLFVVS
jgi:amino acid transporter